ncbi:4Fe-4S ferredoxin [Desulfocarbo indianensis]|nr:4Fe-4S ferredoxin [Desulfocarbo indianensis]
MPDNRKIIEIDEERCDGCGQCILACAEGALRIVDGKARLVGDIYCDGLGACLGECPQGALRIIERPAEAFDEEAVEELLAGKEPGPAAAPAAHGCPSAAAMTLPPAGGPMPAAAPQASRLGHWPVKLQLMNPQAPFLQGADMVLLADCAAVAIPDLHRRFLEGAAVALACPKLDDAEAHAAKLAQLLAGARPRSIKVVHMEVPCCKGLEWIVAQALERSGLRVPVESVVIGRDGAEREDLLPAAALA